MHARDVLLALLGALVAVSLGSQGVWAQQSHRYPAWFRTPPSGNGALWAVGYAPAYSDLQDGIPKAKEDAYEALRRAVRVVVIGEKLYEAAPGYGTALQGENFVETGLPDTLRSVSYVDSLKAGGMTLVLAQWSQANTGAAPAASGSRASFSKTPPSWVKNELTGGQSGAERGPKRAVGIAPRYYNLETSWRLAEKRARRKIAFKAATKVESLDKSTQAYRHDVRSVTTGVDLRKVQVLARWADDENCYVLTTARVEEVLLK